MQCIVNDNGVCYTGRRRRWSPKKSKIPKGTRARPFEHNRNNNRSFPCFQPCFRYRNILLSILLAVPFVTMIYVLMNVSYLTVLSVAEMTSVPAVAVVSASNSVISRPCFRDGDN